jgi:DNA mismatch repair protein MutS
MMTIISDGLSKFLDKLIDSSGKTVKSLTNVDSISSNKNDSINNSVRIESNDRDGHFLILTKRRADILQKQLEKDKQIIINYNNNGFKDKYIIKYDELIFKHLPKGNNSKIFFPMLEHNSTKLNDYIEQLKILNKQYYLNIIEYLSNNFSHFLQNIIDNIALIDFLKSGALIAINNHYYKPIIKNHPDDNDKSYIITSKIRHPLIELINNTEYIPTDIHIGINNQDGILLYGLNSAGKSSLQKSIGINLIMAQMGYFVAANSFIYKPYYSLFTRITSNDNLFKGLSSFALELVELRAILKRSGLNTLVIADEVCKGTEHQSSIIIVSSMIKILSDNKTSFITATHLHELIEVETIKKCIQNNIKIFHLHVSYNDKTNELIYDRILRKGNGEHFYGLNVAKHFINMDNFLSVSNDIKNEYFNNHLLVKSKHSNYNNNLYMDSCSICNYKPKTNEIPLETHHIIFQKDFKNNNIRIGIAEQKQHIKMNQLSNLVVLCYKCHDKIDNGSLNIQGWQDTSLGNKLIYQ